MINKEKILKEAQKFLAKGQLDKAILEYEKIVKDSPNDATTHNTIGDLYLKKNDADNAIESYNKASNIYVATGFDLKAIALYKKVLNIKPDQIDIQITLGKLNAKRGMIGNANECYLAAASYFTKQGKKDKAIDIYKILCDLNPENLALQQKLAELYQAEGLDKEAVSKFIELAEKKIALNDLPAATEMLEHAAEKGSDRFDFMRVYSLVEYKLGHYDSAISKLEEAHRLDPHDARIKTLLNEVYIKAEKHEKSIVLLNELLSDTPANLEYKKQLRDAYLHTGDIVSAWRESGDLLEKHIKQNEFSEAEQLLLEYLAVKKDSFEARHALTDIYARMGDERKSLTVQLEIVRLYIATGEGMKAQNSLSKLQEHYPGNADIAAVISEIGGVKPNKIDENANFAGSSPDHISAAHAAVSTYEPETPSIEFGNFDLDTIDSLSEPSTPAVPETTPELTFGVTEEEPPHVFSFDDMPESANEPAKQSIPEFKGMDGLSTAGVSDHELKEEQVDSSIHMFDIENSPIGGGDIDFSDLGTIDDFSAQPVKSDDIVEGLSERDIYAKYGMSPDGTTPVTDKKTAPPVHSTAVPGIDDIRESALVFELPDEGKPHPEHDEAGSVFDISVDASSFEPKESTPVFELPDDSAEFAMSDAVAPVIDLPEDISPVEYEDSAPVFELPDDVPEFDGYGEPSPIFDTPEDVPHVDAAPTQYAKSNEKSESDIDSASLFGEEDPSNVSDLPDIETVIEHRESDAHASPYSESPVSGRDVSGSGHRQTLDEELDELEVYIKYGILNKAQDSLTLLLGSHPGNTDIMKRGLDVYKALGDIEGFSKLSAELAEIYVADNKDELAKEVLTNALRVDRGNSDLQDRLIAIEAPSFSMPSHRKIEEKPVPAPEPVVHQAAPTFDGDMDLDDDDMSFAGLMDEVAPVQRPEPVPQNIEAAPEPEIHKTKADASSIAEDLAEADFYSQQGLNEEARGIYRRILATDPDNEDVIARLSALKYSPKPAEQDVVVAPPEPDIHDSREESFFDLGEQLDSEFGDSIFPGKAKPAAYSAPPAPTEQVIHPEPEHEEVIEADGFFDLAAELQDELRDDDMKFDAHTGPFEDRQLEAVFQEFKKGVEDQLNTEDFETHYNLGIAYKEMGMVSDAITEFELAAKDPSRTLDCASMLGLCYLENGDFQLAIDKFTSGLNVGGRADEEYLGLKYDLATAYEMSGDIKAAYSIMKEIAAKDSRFRDVSDRLNHLAASLPAASEAQEPKKEESKTPPKKSKVSYL